MQTSLSINGTRSAPRWLFSIFSNFQRGCPVAPQRGSFPSCYSEQYAPLWLHELTCALSSCPDYKSFHSERSSELIAVPAMHQCPTESFFHCTLAHASKSNHSSHHLLVQVKPTQRLACRKNTVAVLPPPHTHIRACMHTHTHIPTHTYTLSPHHLP